MPNQPVLVGDGGVRPEEDAFDPTEDGSVGADAEGEAKNRQERKSRAAAEHSKAEAEVLKKAPAQFLPTHHRRSLLRCVPVQRKETRLTCR